MPMRAEARITSGPRYEPFLCRLCPKHHGEVLDTGRIQPIITQRERAIH
jgi:hypothetical protein